MSRPDHPVDSFVLKLSRLQDFGITWANLTANSAGRIASFVDYDWGERLTPEAYGHYAGCVPVPCLASRFQAHTRRSCAGAAFNWNDSDDPTHPDETIFATVYEDPKHMKGPLPSWDRNVHYIVSRDFFKTNHEKLVSCGNQFDIISNKVSCCCKPVLQAS